MAVSEEVFYHDCDNEGCESNTSSKTIFSVLDPGKYTLMIGYEPSVSGEVKVVANAWRSMYIFIALIILIVLWFAFNSDAVTDIIKDRCSKKTAFQDPSNTSAPASPDPAPMSLGAVLIPIALLTILLVWIAYLSMYRGAGFVITQDGRHISGYDRSIRGGGFNEGK